MTRPILVALLAAVLASGCVSRPGLVPAGEDPDRLAAAIARRGRGEGPTQPLPRQSDIIPDVLKTTAKVGATCAVLTALGGVLVLAALSHSDPSGLTLGDPFKAIWSDS